MEAMLFYILSSVVVLAALLTVFVANPIYSALFLAVTMVTLAFLFFQLGAYFVGAVQLMVYAGAVMVLFVMVLMLFDLKKEIQAFSSGTMTNFLKIASAGWLCGLIAGGVYMTRETLMTSSNYLREASTVSTQELARRLFTNYVFSFEILGLLLLMVAIGAVAVARTKGGTHDRAE